MFECSICGAKACRPSGRARNLTFAQIHGFDIILDGMIYFLFFFLLLLFRNSTIEQGVLVEDV